MKILALEPYYGGSHRAFMDGWAKHSRHEWTLLHLPASKWKWRMRHGPITLAQEAEAFCRKGNRWDIIFCSEMLNLAEFYGLTEKMLHRLPAVVYFHENQLTYPVRFPDPRDDHFPMTNITTCLAATQVWFNSQYHHRTFLDALPAFLGKMPDHQPLHVIEAVKGKSRVMPPGIDEIPLGPKREEGPLHILWAARWEYDKNPDDFFEALRELKKRKISFRLSVIGPSFRDIPMVFSAARDIFRREIVNWGFQATREEYIKALHQADVIVSTAKHEFFGISVVEAITAGLFPLLPKRLAYPEIIGDHDASDDFFYDGTASHLASRLAELAWRIDEGSIWAGHGENLSDRTKPYLWKNLALRLDDALERIIR